MQRLDVPVMFTSADPKDKGPLSGMARFAVAAATMAFGALALCCMFITVLSPLMFDNPAAADSWTTWFFDLAHPFYVLVFMHSFSPAFRAARTGSRAAARTWLVRQAMGIGCLLLAYAVLLFGCHGSFVCRVV
jgi:hypothetical protein